MPEKAEKPFDGAKVIYIGEVIRKESKQPEIEIEGAVERPKDASRGDLVVYYHETPGFNSYHARCLRVKSDCTVNLGVDILEKNENKKEEIETRLSRVNGDGQSFQEVISRVSLDYETVGAGYLEPVRANDGTIAELYHCPAVHIWRKRRGEKHPFVYKSGSGQETEFDAFDPDSESKRGNKTGELLAFVNYTQASRYYGLPDWRGALPDIEVDYYAVLYNQKFFINSGIPDLAIIVKGGRFDEDVEKEVRTFFQTNFKGVDNAHRTLYLPVNDENIEVKFEKLAVEQKDKDGSFDKLRARCRDNIVSAHGVPPRLVGIITSGQLGGGGEISGQLKIFQEVTINPRQDLFETKLRPVTKAMGIEADWQFQEIDTKIQEKDSEYYPAMVGAGILDANEAREEIGYGAREEEPPEPGRETEDFIEGLEKMIEGF